jgi:hypothetical protein
MSCSRDQPACLECRNAFGGHKCYYPIKDEDQTPSPVIGSQEESASEAEEVIEESIIVSFPSLCQTRDRD